MVIRSAGGNRPYILGHASEEEPVTVLRPGAEPIGGERSEEKNSLEKGSIELVVSTDGAPRLPMEAAGSSRREAAA